MNRYAPVAQLDRALPSEGKGHTFESCRVRQGAGDIQDLSSNRFHRGVSPEVCASSTSGRILAVPTESDTRMSERLETLKKARERMVDDRDTFAKTLAAPFDRDKAERARHKFVETQMLIDAIDRAIAGERTGAAAAA
jgi:hypothetical protein